MRYLTAIPIFNEAKTLESVLREVRRYATDILVVNDGSTDGSADLIRCQPNISVVSHCCNQGYGAGLISAFGYAVAHGYDVLVTMDCDGQHEPGRIPVLLEAIHDCDIVSGSRYFRDFRQDTPAPSDRRFINATITRELNEKYNLNLTDSFCGFKAYRREALEQLRITERGWGMPLQVLVQAARQGLRIKEIGVPRLYIDPNRTFGGAMDNGDARLKYYREVIEKAARDRLPLSPDYADLLTQECCL